MAGIRRIAYAVHVTIPAGSEAVERMADFYEAIPAWISEGEPFEVEPITGAVTITVGGRDAANRLHGLACHYRLPVCYRALEPVR